jgi:NAD(P)-dependent dehydrogenase (short-subunit alcohol dehydrogenase family)
MLEDKYLPSSLHSIYPIVSSATESVMAPRVFLITGTSTGFGLEYVKIILQQGDHVVATARKSSGLKFECANDTNCLLVDLDVTEKSSIDAAFDAAVKKFGRVDVVCNNAGYGLSGEFESLSDKQIRTQMEVNFFGLMDVTRKAMEVMRGQSPKGGIIQQVTSIGGQVGVPTFSICRLCPLRRRVLAASIDADRHIDCASKWAVEGFTEAVQQEVKPEWNIKFTCM